VSKNRIRVYVEGFPPRVDTPAPLREVDSFGPGGFKILLNIIQAIGQMKKAKVQSQNAAN